MELRDFGPAVFEQIASFWGLSCERVGAERIPCCDDTSCDDEVLMVTIVLKRPGAESVTFATTMDLNAVAAVDITPAWALDEIAHMMIGSDSPEGAVAADSQLIKELRRFCWAPGGNEPQLEVRHLAAFAVSSDALEHFVFPDPPSTELHGGSRS